MKRKAKQKEEVKDDVVIEWYGQMIPAEKQKTDKNSNKHENFDKNRENFDKIEENIGILHKNNSENIEKNEENIKKTLVLHKPLSNDTLENIQNLLEKPREKWFKSPSVEESKEKEFLEVYDKESEYIEQMINELQDLVKFLKKSIFLRNS